MVLKNGLSRMRGDSHVRFLGGGGAAMRRCYPTVCKDEGISKPASPHLQAHGKQAKRAGRGYDPAGGVSDRRPTGSRRQDTCGLVARCAAPERGPAGPETHKIQPGSGSYATS